MLTGKSQWQGLVPAGHATPIVKRQREASVLMLAVFSLTLFHLGNGATYSGWVP